MLKRKANRGRLHTFLAVAGAITVALFFLLFAPAHIGRMPLVGVAASESESEAAKSTKVVIGSQPSDLPTKVKTVIPSEAAARIHKGRLADQLMAVELAPWPYTTVKGLHLSRAAGSFGFVRDFYQVCKLVAMEGYSQRRAGGSSFEASLSGAKATLLQDLESRCTPILQDNELRAPASGDVYGQRLVSARQGGPEQHFLEVQRQGLIGVFDFSTDAWKSKAGEEWLGAETASIVQDEERWAIIVSAQFEARRLLMGGNRQGLSSQMHCLVFDACGPTADAILKIYASMGIPADKATSDSHIRARALLVLKLQEEARQKLEFQG